MMIIIYFILAWLAINFITKFVIPVYRTTKQVKKQFKNMADAQKAYQQQYANAADASTNATATDEKQLNSQNVGEYIDFEEVK